MNPAILSPPPPPSVMPPGYLQIADGYYMIESGSCGGGIISTASEEWILRMRRQPGHAVRRGCHFTA